MSRYQEFQELFVNDGQSAHDQSGRCFEAIEELTYQLVDYSGWFSDDVEYITLSQPIAPGKPAKAKRFNRTGRNRERIRDVAAAIDGFWSFGIRFRLRPHVSVPFYPPEVMFVMPIWVGSKDDQLVIKLEPDGREYTTSNWGQLIELTFDRVQKILQGGVQTLLSVGDRREEFQQLGFVLDTETIESLHLT